MTTTAASADRIVDVYQHVDPTLIDPSPDNPRGELGDIGDLAKSVGEMGVIMALVVRTMPGGRFEAVCGHRRLAAALEAHVSTVPVVVRDDLSDGDRLALMVEENRHRAELTPPEEARAFRRLIDDMGWTQQQVATRFDTQQGQVSKRLKLLKLPDVALEALQSRSRGHSAGITVEQALILADLPAAAVKDLFASGPPPDWKIVNAQAQVNRDRQMASRRRELEKAGVTIVDGPVSHNLEKGPVPVWRLGIDDEDESAPAPAHSTLPCHAVVFERGTETAVCTDPTSHATASDPAVERKSRVEKERADKERQAETKSRAEAQDARTGFLRKLLVDVPTVAATVHVARTLVRLAHSEDLNYDTIHGALSLLQVTVPADGEDGAADPYEVLKRMAAGADSTDLVRMALAVALADTELAINTSWGRWRGAEVKHHFDFMVAAGYELHDFERTQLAVAAAENLKAEVEATVAADTADTEISADAVDAAAALPPVDDANEERGAAGTGEPMQGVDVPVGEEGVLESTDGPPAGPVHETKVAKAGKKFRATCSCGGLNTLNTTETFADTAVSNHLKAVGADLVGAVA